MIISKREKNKENRKKFLPKLQQLLTQTRPGKIRQTLPLLFRMRKWTVFPLTADVHQMELAHPRFVELRCFAEVFAILAPDFRVVVQQRTHCHLAGVARHLCWSGRSSSTNNILVAHEFALLKAERISL